MEISRKIDNRNCIVLRDFELQDIPNKVRWINDPKNNAFLHYDIPLLVDKTQEWFRDKDNSKRLDCTILYNDIPIGVIGLLNIDYYNRKAEYYITLGESKFKNKGCATIASFLLLQYAFDKLGLNKVYLNVDAENKVAIKLYEKVGFSCEGVFREDMLFNNKLIDRKRYAILAKEYKK